MYKGTEVRHSVAGRHRSHAAVAILGALVLAPGCDRPDPLEVALPAAAIADAGSPAGNAHFHFLPPIREAAYSGEFNPLFAPEVEVCEWVAGACATVVARFTSDGTGDGVVSVSHEDEHYLAVWKVASPPGSPLRIRVLLGAVELGHADVIIVSNGKALKDVDEKEYVGVVENQTLPIKFRIESGAYGVSIGPEGGTLQSSDGKVTLDVPAGALDESTTLTVDPVLDPPADPGLLAGSAYDFGPDGTVFPQGITVEIGFDPASLPPGVAARRLRLHKRVGAMWREVPGSTVDLVNNKVSGLINSFSEYAVVASPAVHTGVRHSCSLDVGGVARCWGGNLAGQLGAGLTDDFSAAPVIVAAPAGGFAALATGAHHACGLTSDGTAYCWGWNEDGQLGTGDQSGRNTPVPVATNTKFKAISGGFAHTCALAFDDSAHCWGRALSGQLGTGVTGGGPELLPQAVIAPDGKAFKSISAGDVHTCGLTTDGLAYCWGFNGQGAVGTGSTTPSRLGSPTQVTGGHVFLDVSASGVRHNCGVTLQGEAYCWGLNNFGQLGIGGPSTPVATPTRVATTLEIVAVSGGTRNSCAIAGDRAGYCWGDNWYGTLGNGNFNSSGVPVAVTGGITFKSISTGSESSCGVAIGGEAYCWGHDGYGELGTGTIASTLTPKLVLGGLTWSSVAGGDHMSCGIAGGTLPGSAYCWGRNLAGSLGTAGGDTQAPAEVLAEQPFLSVHTHANMHVCGIVAASSASGPVQCWGGNNNGQLGTGDFADRFIPAPLSDTRHFVQVVSGGAQNQPGVGNAFSCGLDTNGAAWCWGFGLDGQLGDGSSTSSNIPRAVAGGHVYTSITAGERHACALNADGDLHCWGFNGAAAFGDGSLSNSTTPVPAGNGKQFKQVSAGWGTCAIDLSDHAWCWGGGGNGQLGNGFVDGSWHPVAVSGGHTFAQISSGRLHVCGVTTANQLFCWGDNPWGQVGDGGLVDQGFPVAVASGLSFRSVAASRVHTCAISTTDQLYCWGHRGLGRLGTGEVAYHNTPQLVAGSGVLASLGLRGMNRFGSRSADTNARGLDRLLACERGCAAEPYRH